MKRWGESACWHCTRWWTMPWPCWPFLRRSRAMGSDTVRDSRTRMLLEAPIAPTLLRLAAPNVLVLHALVIAAVFSLIFTLAVVGGGRWLYTRMGGTGGALDAALTYSNWVFAGALLVWVFNTLSAVIRGTGNMAVPAYVTVLGALVLVPLSPLLIFGWGPVPGLGIAGGAIALMAYYLIGSVVLAAYLWSPHSLLRPSF